MNLREALRDAEHLGCEVTRIHRTGELRVKAPDRDRTVKLNSRRKDCPKSLETVVQQLRKKVRQLMRKDVQRESKGARAGGNRDYAPGPQVLGNGTMFPTEGTCDPEEDLRGDQGKEHALGTTIGHPPGQAPAIATAKPELSPEERKRLQHKLDGVILEIRRLEAFYAKERQFRFKIPKRCEPSRQEEAEAKDAARLQRMEETAKKIGELCCKREVLRVNLRR